MIFYLIHIPLIGVLAQLIWKQQHSSFSKMTFYAAFLLKLLCGIALGVLYFNFYGAGDTTSFHQTALELTALGKQNLAQYINTLFASPAELSVQLSHLKYIDQPRAFFMVKILSLLNFFTGGSYWLNSLYLSVFSFWGMWKLATTLIITYPATKTGAAVAFLFYPSVIFWSSGLIKESLMAGAIGLLSAFFLEMTTRENYQTTLWKAAMAVFSAWLIFELKFYYAAVLFPLLLVTGIATRLGKNTFISTKRKLPVMSLLVLMLAVSFFAATTFHSSLRLDAFPEELVLLYQLSQTGKTGTAATFPGLAPTYFSLSQHLPAAVFTGLFRPLPFEAANPLQLLASLENLLLLGATLFLLILAIHQLWAKRKNQLRQNVSTTELLTLGSMTFLYIIIMAWLLTLAYPNFGTQARYRVGYLPFYVYLVFSSLQFLVRSLRKSKGSQSH